ncbi:restriction endonuclease [Nonomuraea sp. FMUSA5-5]|uniref:Restriction endonuclease n=1 Tax=Nonomuraea composti TaxID=2720023 RepID=A0ABX1BKY0_9ACTN|nr:restriction endonuclease [Nonomuraea sp. FMUSA5-5]NJP96436.1 restriction endonuclease [Nonomuraea sp. FMUSA5-5]
MELVVSLCHDPPVTDPTVPTYKDLLWPTLTAVRALDGSGSIAEISSKVIESERFSEEQQAILNNKGSKSLLEERIGWARSYLKGMGLLTNSRRVWSLTEYGRTVRLDEIDKLHRDYQQTARNRSRQESNQATEPAQEAVAPLEDELPLPDSSAVESGQEAWREVLREALVAMSPDAFERLSQRLLREAGFYNTHVTKLSGDGGIDGWGKYRISLVSFPVFFQCKRYRQAVGAPEVQAFRGALSGRGDRGLMITTGTFTEPAKKEATRDGAIPIDLIDGDQLCDLLKEYGIGVTTTIRQVEDVVIDTDFLQGM